MSITDNLLHHGFHLIDDFLPSDHYQALQAAIQLVQHQGGFKPAKIGSSLDKIRNTAIRNDAIYWLDKTSGNAAIISYLTILEDLCNQLNESLYLGLIDYEAHFAIYGPNHFYKKHVDQFATKQDRRISCVYYLNEDWMDDWGGELILYHEHKKNIVTHCSPLDNTVISIKPYGNRFICFSSDIPHEVLTTQKTRLSIASWLKIRPMTLVT